MKIKTIIAALIGVLVVNGAVAGTSWCPPDKGGKSIVDDCPDIGGNISVGYDTAYLFKGVRRAHDVMWGDVNYTFENLPFSPNIGVWHLTDLASGRFTYGDETNIYMGINLPSVLRFDNALRYTHYLYPNTRGPSPGAIGDGLSELTLTMSRNLMLGFSASYSADFLWGGNGNDGWMHTFAINKGIDLTDNIGLDLSGGLLYNDNYYSEFTNGFHPNVGNFGNDSGWHSYFIRAGLPIALNCRATLTPYIQYNGTPDTWVADGFWPRTVGPNANRNDVFFGGVSIGVDF